MMMIIIRGVFPLLCSLINLFHFTYTLCSSAYVLCPSVYASYRGVVINSANWRL